MERVCFTKFSRERQEKFQIQTKIVEDEGKRTVWKLPLCEQAEQHLMAMKEHEHVLKEMYTYPGLSICPCEWNSEKKGVCFPFLSGISMDQRISEFGKKNQFEKIRQEYVTLWEILSSVRGLKDFQVTDLFQEIFGTVSLPEGLMASEVSNVDMLPANILVDEDTIWVTDYEWVFSFPIPTSFLYARSIFLQETCYSLPPAQQKELYHIAGILPEQISVYYEMEKRLQAYVTGKERKWVLDEVYQKLHRKKYPVSFWQKESTIYPLQFWETEPRNRQLFYEDCFDTEVVRSFDTSEENADAVFSISVLGESGVIKIRSLTGSKDGRQEKIPFCHNAELEIIDDYYFSKIPVITFQNRGFDSIQIDFLIYFRGEGITLQLIHMIRENKNLLDEKEAFRQKTISQQEEMQKISGEKKFLEEELERMRQRKVVRMADAVQKAIKRS